MNGYSTSEDVFSRRLEMILDRVEAELGHATYYVDRVVVPEVRREAGSAARLLAGHLERLATKLNPNQEPGGKPGL
jgi:hypothetical protein